MDHFNSDAIYFLASTIIGILFFLLGNWYNRKLINKLEISFVLNEWLPIITTAKDIQFLQFPNYTPPQNTNVYYLKGIVANTGDVDIDRSTIHKALNVEFPDDFTIVRQSHSFSNDLITDVSISNNTLIVDWNLLKHGETVTLELIIETKQILTQPQLEKKIKINHRIVNLKKIKIFSIYPYELTSYNDRLVMGNWLLIGCVAVGLLWSFLIYTNTKTLDDYKYPESVGQFESVERFQRVNDSLVTFYSEKDQYAVKLSEISRYFRVVKEPNTISKYLGPIMVAGGLFIIGLLLNVSMRRSRRRADLIMGAS